MTEFCLSDVVTATSAVHVSSKEGPERFSGVSIDSRTVREGELFVAIRGPRFDGHDFVAEALARGAAAALIDVPPAGLPSGSPLWRVPDTLAALGHLARFHRDRFGIALVAVTGSCGKTTTKTMLAHILSSSRPVLSTPGTQNNRIGVPLTLLRLNEDYRVAVLELGSNQWGEIRTLTQTARPTLGVVTNVGPAHLEAFGSLKGVLRAKAELWEAMDPDAPLVLNGDDPLLLEAGKRLDRPVAWFGFGPQAQLQIDQLEHGPAGSRGRIDGRWVLEVPLPGQHSLLNALAALTCAQLLGVELSCAVTKLKTLPSLPGRVTLVQRDGVVWVDDTYNANPASLQAGLEVLQGIRRPGRKVVVVGDMLELGKEAQRLHAEAGRRVALCRPDLLVAVGPLARHLLEAAWESGLPEPAGCAFGTAEEAGEFLAGWVRPGDVVLVKGSRAMRMERALECSTTSSIR